MRSVLALAVAAAASAPPLATAQTLPGAAPGTAQGAAQGADAAAAAAAPIEPYRIGAEDLLDISVWNNSAVSRVVPVRPDGRISLPLVPDVQAAGLTPTELADVLRRKLAEYIKGPDVSVVVKEVHSLKVSVLGEVKTPGRYEFKSRATVLDALAMAGGFSDFASRSRVEILHQSAKGVERVTFDYKKFVDSGQTRQCPVLHAGDVVVVP